MRILIVADDARVRDMLEGGLGEDGYDIDIDIDTASDGRGRLRAVVWSWSRPVERPSSSRQTRIEYARGWTIC